MVCKKRLEFGFIGYGTPMVPRAPRSMRRKKSGEDEKLRAFELLASVAGKLLEESEGSASSNAAEIKLNLVGGNEKEIPNIGKASFKCENVDRGSCDESVFFPETSIQDHSYSPIVSGTSEKLDSDMKLGVREGKSSKNIDISNTIGPLYIDEQLHLKEEYGSEVRLADVKGEIEDLSVANGLALKDHVEGFVTSSLNSESSVQLPLYRELFPCGLLQKHRNNVKLGIRDDDENFPGFNKRFIQRTFRPQPRTGHRRVRKMMTSRYWKTAPKMKDCERLYTTTSQGMNSFYKCRRSVYSRERFQRAPIKKRGLSDHRFSVAFECQDNSSSVSKIPGKVGDGSSTYMKVHSKSKERHVAVSIKSFKVPELYFEVPESATVGSLKRTVLEEVTAILGRGIRVGIVFQGKNIRDDNRTLLQVGISQYSDLDNLGFTLEPSLAHLPANPKPEPDSVSPATPVIGDSDPIKQDSVANKELMSSFSNLRPADDNDMSIDGTVPQSMALVPVADALAPVLINQKAKPKRSEVAPRRTRRPFSVAEVEALVEAVEQLGTGRWRDVKMRAFENADHRTYVDLKDKWKTLVHTASISPQQRRGEPVPHELLNRVLSAHSYWSHHQSKHGKLQALEPPRIADIQEAAAGA